MQKRRPSVQECHATKKCHAWFCWYKACVFMFADETTWLWFPDTSSRKRQNNYIIFLFISSGLYSCRKVTFIMSVISRETSWTKNAVNLYFCLTHIFLVWPFYFQYLQSSQHAFVNSIIPISIQHTWSYQCYDLSKNLDTNCRCIPHVFGSVLALKSFLKNNKYMPKF
mgnify:CR=1 FL=1